MSTPSKSHAALAVEAVYALANDPEHWDLLLAALDQAPTPAPERESELTELVAGSARIAERNVPPVAAEAAHAGVIVVSRAGRERAANDAVTPALRSRIGFDDTGTLAGPAADVLRDNLRRFDAASASIILKFGEEQDEPLFVYAMPIADLDPSLARSLTATVTDRAAIALVIPAQHGLEHFWSGLRDSFGLTQAETRLASLLKDGLSLKEAAAKLDLSVNTVRNQLTSVFAKLGLNRQSDLVRSLTQLAALANTASPPSQAAVSNIANAPPVRSFHLPDGRKLAWREFGPADGRPALLFHPGLGASLLLDSTAPLAHRLRLRLIAPERAGQGQSDPDPHFCFESVARDTVALADHLQLDRFPLAALTSGARFGLAAAAQLGNRVSRILLASPRIPMKREDAGVTSPMVQFQRRVTTNLWLLDPVFSIMRTRLSRPVLSRIMHASATGPGDAAYLKAHPELVDLFVTLLKESMAVSSRGATDEMKTERLSGGPDLTLIRAPISVWHGAEDTYATPKEVMAYLDGQTASLRTIDGIGNYLIHRHWLEIVAWLSDSNRPG